MVTDQWLHGEKMRMRHPTAVRWLRSIALLLIIINPALAQETFDPSELPRNRYRKGEETLRAFAPVSAATRQSIVKLNVDGATVSLGAIVSSNGLALTKASEIKPGKLTCWLAREEEVAAEVLAIDQEQDVALVRVDAAGLKPIEWGSDTVFEGQWVVTPGIAETPHAVGIISALPRQIKPLRAFIGVQFDIRTSEPRIEELIPGLGAEKAGLKPGDVLVSVNDTAVTNRQQVIEILRDFREGKTVKLRAQRDDAQVEAEVTMMVPRAQTSGEDGSGRNRSDRLRGEVSLRAEGFEQAIEHDTVLQPWLCGGPLVNLDGKTLGLNIARASRVTTYALPAAVVQRIFAGLMTSATGKGAPLSRTPNAP